MTNAESTTETAEQREARYHADHLAWCAAHQAEMAAADALAVARRAEEALYRDVSGLIDREMEGD